MLKFKSVKTKNLSQIQIKEMCNLKNLEWKFGIKSQLKNFRKNIKPEDVHNCFYLKKKLIGYTLLRNRNLFIENKKSNYFLFDTLIIRKSLRKKVKEKSLRKHFKGGGGVSRGRRQQPKSPP